METIIHLINHLLILLNSILLIFRTNSQQISQDISQNVLFLCFINTVFIYLLI